MELEGSKPGKQGLLKQETQYPDSDEEQEDKYFERTGRSPDHTANKSFEEADPDEERDKMEGLDSPNNVTSPGGSNSLHFLVIYDKVKTTYFSLCTSNKYTEGSLDLKSLKKTMSEMKIEKREVYRTTNSPDADWTSIFVKGGLYVSALFDKRVLIGERMKLLLQIKKVIQEATKTINLATNSRVVKRSTEEITAKCKDFSEAIAACVCVCSQPTTIRAGNRVSHHRWCRSACKMPKHVSPSISCPDVHRFTRCAYMRSPGGRQSSNRYANGFDSKLDKEKYARSFEELLSEVDITDISEEGYEQKFPDLKDFIADNLMRFQRLEAWRSGKSKLIVAVFACLMLLGIIAKFLSLLFRK